MKGITQRGNFLPVTICSAAILLCTGLTGSFGDTTPAAPSPRSVLMAGERIYREGVLPSGKPVQALVKGDIPMTGTAASCVGCHLRSGLGSAVAPSVSGTKLFRPLPIRSNLIGRDAKEIKAPPRRPAYTDETLAALLRTGIDPAGRVLHDAMPRYLLGNDDMALLISYLKSLSSDLSPGVSDTTIRFATVISDDVSRVDREAMLAPLQAYVEAKNNQARFVKSRAGGRSRMISESLTGSKDLADLTVSLSSWTLKGPPETWRGQLEEFYRKEPVFALIGGMTPGGWEPVHRFCEENRIPCLFPGTDFPVVSRADWYTLYLSKGYYQEGEGAARYLNRRTESRTERPVVQIVRASREGEALSAGFRDAWRDSGRGIPVTVTLKRGEELTGEVVQRLLAREKPAAVVVWDGPAALAALGSMADDPNRPEMVFVSSSYLGTRINSLSDRLRGFTYVTYPYRLPRDMANPANPTMGKKIFSADTTKITNQTYAVTEVLTTALVDMKGNYYRDNFLDVIDMLPDQEVPLYERLSFGPGERYASKGCYIVQLSNGPKPELIRKSDWVTH